MNNFKFCELQNEITWYAVDNGLACGDAFGYVFENAMKSGDDEKCQDLIDFKKEVYRIDSNFLN